jgi:ATP-dependent DNA helicase 2 subunit 1
MPSQNPLAQDADELQRLDGTGDDDDADDSEWKPKRDLKIYLIDAHAAMNIVGGAGDNPLQLALKCVAKVLTDQIISSANNRVGVCLYGTKEKENNLGFEGVYLLQSLDQPDATRIKELRDLAIEGDARMDSFGSRTSKCFEFQNALWVCQDEFSHVSYKNTTKSIHIMTNNDDPSDGDSSLQQLSVQKGRDLESTGIEMVVYKFPGADQFRPQNFYSQVMKVPLGDEGTRIFDATSLEKLNASIRRKQFPLRSTGTLPMKITEGLSIAVSVYSLIMKVGRPTSVNLEQTTNKPVKIESSYICTDTGNMLQDNEIGFSYGGYGGATHVVFDKEEIKDLKHFGTPQITLLGFKPRATLLLHHNIKHNAYLRAEETYVTGSTTVFLALVNKMLARNVVALASVVPRKASTPRLAILYPQREADNTDPVENTIGKLSDGLHMIWLPYCDDLRNVALPKLPEPSDEAIIGAKRVVDAFKMDKFDCRNYANPQLQKHFRNLETIALEEDVAAPIVDQLQPGPPAIDPEVALLRCTEYREAVLGDDWDEVRTQKPAKASAKRVAVGGEVDISTMDWQTLVVPVRARTVENQGVPLAPLRQPASPP